MFSNTRQAVHIHAVYVSRKAKRPKKQGKGNKPCKSDHLLPTEVEKMWQTGALGTQNPQSLQYTLWWYLMTEAGMRASCEHLFLCWGDVKLKTTTEGKRYIEHMERQTKMRMGEGAATKQPASKIFENASDPSRCLVQAYLKFEEKRREAMKTDDARFYLQALNKPVEQYELTDIWYNKQPLGISSIQKFMKNIPSRASITHDKKISNTSARKYSLNQMKRAHIPPTDIAQKSGHRNIQSINRYQRSRSDGHRSQRNIAQCPNGIRARNIDCSWFSYRKRHPAGIWHWNNVEM